MAGVTRPVDQEVGSGLVVAFLRAGDAIACALELQLSTLAPMRPRVGVHTGDVRLRGDGTITGSAINESACLRDLAHEGQTLLSAATGDLVIDQLPANTWLTDVGKYPCGVCIAKNGLSSCVIETYAMSFRRCGCRSVTDPAFRPSSPLL